MTENGGQDPLPTPEPVLVVESEPNSRRPRGMVCEMCGCTLAADGAVLRRGKGAEEYLDQKDRIKGIESKLADARETIAAKDEEIRQLREKYEAKRRSTFGF